MADDQWEKFLGDASPTQVTKTSIGKDLSSLQKQNPQSKELAKPAAPKFTDDELFTEFSPKKSSDGFLTIVILVCVLVFILYSSLYFLKFFQIYDFSKTIGVSIFSPVDAIFGVSEEPKKVEYVSLTKKDIQQIKPKVQETTPAKASVTEWPADQSAPTTSESKEGEEAVPDQTKETEVTPGVSSTKEQQPVSAPSPTGQAPSVNQERPSS